MWKHWVEWGLALQVLGVIPPVVVSLLSGRVVDDQEVGIPVQMRVTPGPRDYFGLIGGLSLVALGAACQLVGLYKSP